jgi:MFS family permease
MFIKRRRRDIRNFYREYRRSFWILVGATFIDRLGGSLLFPFFALYITEKFNVGMTEVGVLFALFSLSSFIGSFLGGALTDRLGRRRMLIFGLLASSFSTLLMGFIDSLQAFYVLALLSGVFTDVAGPAHQAMVADLVPEQKRAEGYGILRVAFNLAVTIGPAIGGFMATRSYQLLFVTDAGISTITAGIVYFFLRETKPQPRSDAKPETIGATFKGYGQVLRDGVFMLFVFMCILMGLVYMNMSTTLGVYLRDVYAVPESGYGALLSINALMVVVLQFPISRRITDRPPLLMMAIGTALYALGFGLYGIVTNNAMFVLAMVIITVGEMIVAPVSQSLTARFAPEDMRGRYMAVFGISWGSPS